MRKGVHVNALAHWSATLVGNTMSSSGICMSRSRLPQCNETVCERRAKPPSRDHCSGAQFRVAPRWIVQRQAGAVSALPVEAIDQHKMTVVADQRATFTQFRR